MKFKKCAVMLNFETSAYAFYYLIVESYVTAQAKLQKAQDTTTDDLDSSVDCHGRPIRRLNLNYS